LVDGSLFTVIKAAGPPYPGGGDAKRIAYYYPGRGTCISGTTRVIDRYYRWKEDRKRDQDKAPAGAPPSVFYDTNEYNVDDVDGEDALGIGED